MGKTFVIEETSSKDPKNSKEKYKNSDKDIIKIIDAVLDVCPQIKRDRTMIINAVLGRVEKTSSVILEKITVDGATLYRDKEGRIFDVDVKLQGCYVAIHGEYSYHTFAERDIKKEIAEVDALRKKLMKS